MPIPQGFELIIIAIVALILFGGTKLAGFGKNAGRAIREFKEESRIIENEKADPTATMADAEKRLDAEARTGSEVAQGEFIDEQKPGHQA